MNEALAIDSTAIRLPHRFVIPSAQPGPSLTLAGMNPIDSVSPMSKNPVAAKQSRTG
jgi:hypothetical protein